MPAECANGFHVISTSEHLSNALGMGEAGRRRAAAEDRSGPGDSKAGMAAQADTKPEL